MITVQEMIDRTKAEIVQDVRAGLVPAAIDSFFEIYKYVDPNCYGGAEELFHQIVTASQTDAEQQKKLDIVYGIMKPAREAVDAWIKRGGIAGALAERLTIWRPKTVSGLGAPVAYLGDEHPTEGDWHQSAKADLIDGNAHFRLHQMGRDFLIYSMYHVREPFYLSLAVENFGTACQKLGYKLPLAESEAAWRVYAKNELEPAPPSELQMLLGQISKVFGPSAARDQASELDFKLTFPFSNEPN